MGVLSPEGDDDWIGLTGDALPVEAALSWAQQPSCGAVVLFSGTVRNFAEGRPDVAWLEYEAYEGQVTRRLAAIVEETRARWQGLGRIAVLHRVGRLTVGESAVVVVVSAAHRAEAFEAARFCIDTLKAAAPIWKRESWAGGEDWAACVQPLSDSVAGVAGT